MVEEYFGFYSDENRLRCSRMDKDRKRSGMRVDTDGFRCLHCGAYVTREALFSGVINRNHCPYCLWSRHVDWRQAGDRMSACKGKMSPVGLALKHAPKKYNHDAGELMVIHACTECSHVSLNRIAADDSAEELFAVFQASLVRLPAERMPHTMQIEPLNAQAQNIVRQRLFGTAEAESICMR